MVSTLAVDSQEQADTLVAFVLTHGGEVEVLHIGPAYYEVNVTGSCELLDSVESLHRTLGSRYTKP
jgi:hypothetical protein